MTKNAKLSIIAIGFAVLVVGALLIATGGDDPPSSTSATPIAGSAEVVADNTHFLQEGSSEVTVTEFLDFECESCLALFPIMERLREEYDGEVGFAIRYFPIASHANAQIAAQAVEAASKQGALEEMYIKMYETQPEWGEQQESKRDLFISFAEEMGLDMEQFEEDLDAQSTIDRVNFDQQAGTELGVTGTPTLFLNGEPFQPGPYEQMKAEIDAALDGS
jgi:protein-disulfide isomerase